MTSLINPVHVLPVGSFFIHGDINPGDGPIFHPIDTKERDQVSIVTEHEVTYRTPAYGTVEATSKTIQQRGEVRVQTNDDGTIELHATTGAIQITPVSRNIVRIRIVDN